MKNLLPKTLIALLAVFFTAQAQAAPPTLYGNLIYTGSWGAEDATKAGIYSFAADASGDVSPEYIPEGTNIYGNGGAVYVDGKYYVLTHVPNTGSIQKNTLYVYDISDWSLLEQKDAPLTTSANDLTYCPVDNKVYGTFMNSSASGYVFGTLNLADGSVDVVKALDIQDELGPMPILALAADTAGDIYGVGADGNLYRFDRTTGDYTLIGATGFIPARWNQSATFDFTTKEMYWAACNADRSALFKIDLATGHATSLREFTDDEEFVGLYSTSSVADLNGPQAVTDLTVDLDGAALAGTISFTLPSLTIAGNDIQGDIDYTVEDNGAVMFRDTGTRGSSVTRDISLTEGLHRLVVYASTAAGKGASARITVFAGNDTPAMPTGLSVQKDGDAVNIAWNAVTTGANKGYVDPSAVTYTVTRTPGDVIVAEGLAATSYTDTQLPVSLAEYTYRVHAVCAGKKGVDAVSESITLGSVMEAPFSLDLTKENEFKFFSTEDANRDSKTWVWSVNGAVCNYSNIQSSDDWLISPFINLKAGFQYTITLEMRAGNSRYAETYEIMAGLSKDIADLTIPVLEDGAMTNNTRHPETVIFTPETDGAYCFGIHCTSPKRQYNLYVYTFSIAEPVSLKAPVASSEVSATAGAEGALQATIKAMSPAKAVDGSDLTSLERAEVTNLTTGKTVDTVTSPAVGSEISVTDNEAANGFNEYSVVFYNAAGKGYAATTKVYVGEDTPIPVTDVALRQENDAAILTWTAPTQGVNGGYINTAGLRYRVALASNNADVATDISECTYVDKNQDAATQHTLQYTVYAFNNTGESKGYNSNMLIFGNAYDAPFAESFPGGKTSMNPWITVKGNDGGYPEWTASTKSMLDTTDPSQDGDLGWMKYSSKGTITLQSPIIDIASLGEPQLKFWYKAAEDTGDAVSLQVLLSTDRGLTWIPATSLDVSSTEWKIDKISLASVKGCKNLQIAFKASCMVYQDMYLDNITVADTYDYDLGIVSLTGPTTPVAGTTGKYAVKISNNGTAAAATYTVEIYGNDRLLTSVPGHEIAPDGIYVAEIDVTVPVNFTRTTLTAKINCADDKYAANNEATLDITATTPRLPVIETLAGTSGVAGVTLNWERPATERNPSAITDDLESLTAWDFGGVTAGSPSGTIGDYNIYDGDGTATVVASSYMKQPNGGNPMAFQVNKNGNPYPDVDLNTFSINSHSGNHSLMAWGAVEGASSDWLILPELFPGETTISFWAHATPMGYGSSPAEKLEVLYSATGNDIADFTSFIKDVDVPSGFTSDPEKGFHFFEYTLPSDAKYAAVRVSLSTTANKSVVIDDIRYTAASSPKEKLEISGYNVYRDGVLIGTTDTESYTDQTGEGHHVYNVTTRYDKGESPFSNDVDVEMSGIEDVTVETGSGTLRYYNLQGIEVKNPARGTVYIVVSADGTTTKRIVR